MSWLVHRFVLTSIPLQDQVKSMIEGAEKSEDHDMVGAVAKASGCWCHALRAFTYMFFGVAFNFPALSLKILFWGQVKAAAREQHYKEQEAKAKPRRKRTKAVAKAEEDTSKLTSPQRITKKVKAAESSPVAGDGPSAGSGEGGQVEGSKPEGSKPEGKGASRSKKNDPEHVQEIWKQKETPNTRGKGEAIWGVAFVHDSIFR